MKIVILCGGNGSRLWPLSRQNKPKQFYNVISDRSLLVDTYERFTKDYSLDDIYFSTLPAFKDLIKNLLPDISDDHIICEPEKRDTGPAMGYVATLLSLKFPDEVIVFIASDHYIANIKKFILSLKIGESLVKKTGKLLDISLTPNFPSTNLGYTKIGEKFLEVEDVNVYRFIEHREKPNFEQAKSYVESGDYLWHGNFYMWTANKFLEAFKRYSPEIYTPLNNIRELMLDSVKSVDLVEKIKFEFIKCPVVSFDYSITEKMNKDDVLIIKGDFGWSDIGAWDILYNQLSTRFDENHNLIRGKVISLDARESLVYNFSDKLMAVYGVNNLVIVNNHDSILICDKSKASGLKKIIEEIKNKNYNSYL